MRCIALDEAFNILGQGESENTRPLSTLSLVFTWKIVSRLRRQLARRLARRPRNRCQNRAGIGGNGGKSGFLDGVGKKRRDDRARTLGLHVFGEDLANWLPGREPTTPPRFSPHGSSIHRRGPSRAIQREPRPTGGRPESTPRFATTTGPASLFSTGGTKTTFRPFRARRMT